ncbi:hypothetical protein [Celerinatantimonas sp. MCCC 1A17872]|uniref:hypothetical protein n=1 Tax=Celerinatantimonas sp. MCCC 1A17872 TaxID=3177514 RepID=UPI0038C1CC31
MFNFIKNEKGAVIPFLFISAYLLFILLIPFRACASVDAGLDALSHHEFAKAEKIFAEQADKGDAHAMYWLGNTYQLEGGMKRLDAGRILLKAAKMGDPWAMYRLYTKNPYSLCTVWPCSSRWDSKAVEIWERQSKQGNGKATFALALRKDRTFWYNVTKWLPGMGQERLNKMALKAFRQGYQGASFYLANNIKSDYLHYLIKSSGYDFIPSYSRLAIYYKDHHNIKLMEKYKNIALQYGDRNFINYLFEVYSQGLDGYKKDFKKAYFYGKILSLYGKDVDVFFKKTGLKEYRLDAKFTDIQKKLFIKKAKEFVSAHPPYHYYDEFSFPFDGMDF